ncbi:MAG: 5'/3'-nucleotidase SurE [Treponema sp.]|nr:5'/3'-nucleotidase SurE [Treponema sp.]
MRLLLTNDDGADSPGILLLAHALRGAGHRVFMVAPSSDNSGVSHSISFFKGSRKLAEIQKDSYSFDGTPVDCVIVALRGGIPELDATAGGAPLDAVISGINRGANLGTDIVFSGTAAAARQGAFYGIPSLALSLVHGQGETWHWDMAVAFAMERLGDMLAYWKPDSFVNVNIPNRDEKPLGLVHSFPSLRCYSDRIDVHSAADGNRYCVAKLNEVGARPDRGSDWKAVSENNASLSEIFIHPVLASQCR